MERISRHAWVWVAVGTVVLRVGLLAAFSEGADWESRAQKLILEDAVSYLRAAEVQALYGWGHWPSDVPVDVSGRMPLYPAVLRWAAEGAAFWGLAPEVFYLGVQLGAYFLSALALGAFLLEVGGAGLAFWAVLVWGLDPLGLVYSLTFMPEAVCAALALGGLWAWGRRHRGARWPVFAGIAWGCATLTKPVLLGLPFVVWLPSKLKGHGAGAGRWMFLVFTLTLFPWVLRQWREHYVLSITPQVGQFLYYNLRRKVVPALNHRDYHSPEIRDGRAREWGWEEQRQFGQEAASQGAEQRRLAWVALQDLVSRPGGWLRSVLKAQPHFWGGTGTNALAAALGRSSPLDPRRPFASEGTWAWIHWLSWAWMAALYGLAFWGALRGSLGPGIRWGALLWIAYVVFAHGPVGRSRYRFLAVPALAALGASALVNRRFLNRKAQVGVKLGELSHQTTQPLGTLGTELKLFPEGQA